MDSLTAAISEFFQFCIYELFKRPYNWPCPQNIRFEADLDKDSKTIIYSAPDYPGLYTVFVQGISNEQLTEMVNDAIFTYFGVPRYIAKRSPDVFQSIGRGSGKTSSLVLPQRFARV